MLTRTTSIVHVTNCPQLHLPGLLLVLDKWAKIHCLLPTTGYIMNSNRVLQAVKLESYPFLDARNPGSIDTGVTRATVEPRPPHTDLDRGSNSPPWFATGSEPAKPEQHTTGVVGVVLATRRRRREGRAAEMCGWTAGREGATGRRCTGWSMEAGGSGGAGDAGEVGQGGGGELELCWAASEGEREVV
jgi:hypothetical protein